MTQEPNKNLRKAIEAAESEYEIGKLESLPKIPTSRENEQSGKKDYRGQYIGGRMRGKNSKELARFFEKYIKYKHSFTVPSRYTTIRILAAATFVAAVAGIIWVASEYKKASTNLLKNYSNSIYLEINRDASRPERNNPNP